MCDCPGDRLIPASPGRLYGLGSNVHRPRSGQLIRRFGPAPGHCGDHPGATEYGDLQRADSAAERDEPAHVYTARLAKRCEYDAASHYVRDVERNQLAQLPAPQCEHREPADHRERPVEMAEHSIR